jgi:hypothetical protein
MTTIIVMKNLDYDDLYLVFLKESKWKNIGIKTGSNVIMDNTIVVDSIIKIISMSLFSNPFET